MEKLPIKIDSEVLKFTDMRVQRLLSAQLSVEAFALSIGPQDPWVLIEDTIYALSEQEYYAMRAVLPANIFTESAFRHVLGLADLSFMGESDRKLIEDIRNKLPGCPKCQYNRYKNETLRLVRKYNIKLPAGSLGLPDVIEADKSEFPPVSETVIPKVDLILDHMYKLPEQTRHPCVDCVEKHVAQAWILGNESLQGYPEHLVLAVGHLGEAIDELPVDMVELKRTLEFCLARTNCYKRPFIPVYLILPLLALARKATRQGLDIHTVDAGSQDSPVDVQLDLTEEIKSELSRLAPSTRLQLVFSCRAIDTYMDSKEDTARLAWEGSMAALADSLASQAPKTANMLRNRRLLFVADPSLAKEAGYDMSDILSFLESRGV